MLRKKEEERVLMSNLPGLMQASLQFGQERVHTPIQEVLASTATSLQYHLDGQEWFTKDRSGCCMDGMAAD